MKSKIRKRIENGFYKKPEAGTAFLQISCWIAPPAEHYVSSGLIFQSHSYIQSMPEAPVPGSGGPVLALRWGIEYHNWNNPCIAPP